MASLNQGFLFIALFVAISVNLSCSPKVMALRDLPIDVAKMKENFFIPLDNEMTCFRSCTSDPDCSDGWEFQILVVKLIIVPSEPNGPKTMGNNGTLGSVQVKSFFLNIHPQLGPIFVGQLINLLNKLNPRLGLYFLPEVYSSPALKENMGDGFQFLLIEMTTRVNIYPYTDKVYIGGELVKGKKPKKGLNLVGSIGFPDSLKMIGFFRSASLRIIYGLIDTISCEHPITG
ncbi:hypothetical protein T459_11210 [Capsicum annuum]|uniref:Uncharacterized protein n=1 Tax=Capsicum annuum TaxID=4072 RepID=A0A2G2ZL93_CAPAN|nr:hypothetical protein T459_11210 [Capsicum annuum]